MRRPAALATLEASLSMRPIQPSDDLGATLAPGTGDASNDLGATLPPGSNSSPALNAGNPAVPNGVGSACMATDQTRITRIGRMSAGGV